MTDNPFKKAVKHEAKLRLAIAGPSGAGKTYTSLAVGTALANGGSVAVVDTEHGSASKYADLFEFDVLELVAPFHPARFVRAIQEAQKAGYAVVILDSLSHAWSGTGGLLEIVDKAAVKFNNNKYMAWSEGTPIQNQLIEAITGADIHVIAAMRSKQEYIITTNSKGQSVPQKVGMAPVQRDSFEYEFDVYLDMDIKNNAVVGKTRCPALAGEVIPKPGADLAEILREWLGGVAVDKPEPKPASSDNGDTVTVGLEAVVENAKPPGIVTTDNGETEAPWTEPIAEAQDTPTILKPEVIYAGSAVAEPEEDIDHFSAALEAPDLKVFAEHAQTLDGYESPQHVVGAMLHKWPEDHGQKVFKFTLSKRAEYLQWLADRKAEEA